MFRNKGKNKMIILALFVDLLVAGFTSQAASLQMEPTADIKAAEMAEHELVNKTLANSITISAIENTKEMIGDKAEEVARQAALAQQQAYELELLASIIFCEAGNQSYEGQVAVGAVVMNRVNSTSYPNTIEEVIYQSGQFTPAMTGWLDRVRTSAGYTDAAMQAAKDALAGENPIGNCLYFDQGGCGMKIGDHFFH